jgi:hypothetical protein
LVSVSRFAPVSELVIVTWVSGRFARLESRMSPLTPAEVCAKEMLVESAQLAVAAAVAAIGFAAFLAPALGARLGTSEFPAWVEVAIDLRTLGFALSVSIATTLLCGAVPALRAAAAAPSPALKQTTPSGSLRWMLAAQVGFSVAVLFLSGLLLQSFRKLITLDLGFSRENVALFDLAPRVRGPNSAGAASDLLDRVRRVPGVRMAAFSGQRPMGGDLVWIMNPIVRLGGANQPVRPREVAVSPGFFQTLGIRWIAGRDFVPEELERPSTSVIVNQAFVDAFFPGRPPLEQEFDRLTYHPEPAHQRIVGVVGNSRWNNVREPEQPAIYSPLRNAAGATMIVRTVSRPGPLFPGVRKEIEAAAPALTARSSILLGSRRWRTSS